MKMSSREKTLATQKRSSAKDCGARFSDTSEDHEKVAINKLMLHKSMTLAVRKKLAKTMSC